MEFKSRLPRDGVNISREHPLKEATVLVIGLGLVFALIFAGLLWFVDIVVALIPPKAEARVFDNWVMDELDIIFEGEEVEEVQALLDRVAGHWPESPYTFRVAVLPQKDPNAMALPGGLILVTRGLLREVETENGLAFVLGHELGHYRHRDHLRGMGRGMVLSMGVGIIAPSASSINFGDFVASLTARSFGREDEHRADRFGLELVHAEFGHVAESWSLFETLHETKQGTSRTIAYLSTHPADTNRIALLLALADERGWPTEGTVTPLTVEYDD